ncbi:DUF3604 domain-containing protein [Aromatoleum toluclasticum]|uniref:DUF3604 domain-containing protein n=1 Tax=Aromatoleum toluclasticum TaxID=92003 RepID=UPI001D1931B1|nr:DUF3604 domain-containing protein [Aromatoleum toluclasticum]
METYSPPARHRNMTNLYWGDTHLHTAASADAYTMEGVLSREEAYRFARGEVVTAANGMKVKLRRPLDFLAVTDHAEYLDVFPKLAKGDSDLTEHWELGKRWAGYFRDNKRKELGLEFASAVQSTDVANIPPEKLRRSIWQEVVESADRHNVPGVFTAFSGYEWTSMITGDNLHRVVLFKDTMDKTGRIVPFSAQDSTDPEMLWRALEGYEAAGSGEVLAIPHNGNVSNGRMFAPHTISGKPLDRAYAQARMRWEPLTEVTQIKGDGETHPKLSPQDEFADFERWDEGNIILSAKKTPDMLPFEYARSALREGLRHQRNIGANPFRFGMIGSTDAHTSLVTTEEDNFFGKFANSEPRANRITSKMAHVLQEDWQLGASGLAAVWAPENTREALFEAFKRREVYGTTGPRIQVRFFGGWNFAAKDVQRPDFAVAGYEKGVPMGGDLGRQPGKTAPTFMVAAARDPDGANLDRVQIIKGWIDAKGATHERVYDVALSGGRKVDKRTGKAPAVGSTVDLPNATYSNTIGSPELTAVWTDPQFDAAQDAFYYARVIEIPKPRWTVYDAHYFKKELPPRVAKVVQDRAYTSPIWYSAIN